MITLEKLKIFEHYKEDVDAFSRAPLRDQKLISEKDFFFITSLLQDLRLVQRKLASSAYEATLQCKLAEACDNTETIRYFNSMASKSILITSSNTSIKFRTHGTKEGQALIIVLTALMTLCFLLFFFFTPTLNMGIMLLLEIIIVVFINYHLRSYFDICINDDQFILENIWGKKSYPLSEFISIKKKTFPFPYPFNPFLVLTTKEAAFTIRMDNAKTLHLLKDGIDKYIMNLVDIMKHRKSSS